MFAISVTISLLFISSIVSSFDLTDGQQKGLSSHVEIGNRAYYVDFHQVTKEKAIEKCTGLKMDLVSFEDVQEYNDVTAWLLDNVLDWSAFWTSGVRAAGSEVWTWGAAGPEISYSSEWVDGRPGAEISEEACLYFMMAFGGWYDNPCGPDEYVSGVLCESYEQ